ncbi:MAG TPA: type II secretion system F family protein [Burkholderiales bacterium]|nr:type II secretion system F family protein [Burkholderiales bacterium]
MSLTTLIAVITVIAVIVVWAVLQLAGTGLSKQKETIARASKTGLEDMFIFVDSTKLFYYNVALLVVVPVVIWFFTDNPVLAVAAAVVVIIIPKYAVSWLRKRRFTTFERQLPDALLMISGAMRAGASLTVAMEGMVKESRPPLSQEFELMLREQRLGVDFDTALKNMEKRLPIQDFIMVISGMRISREVGGNLADILESLADTLRRKHQMEGKINSLTAQGKMQGVVMTCLPLFLMLVLTKMEPEAMHPLWHSMLGWVVLGIIAVMEIIGYLAIRKITNIDV